MAGALYPMLDKGIPRCEILVTFVADIMCARVVLMLGEGMFAAKGAVASIAVWHQDRGDANLGSETEDGSRLYRKTQE